MAVVMIVCRIDAGFNLLVALKSVARAAAAGGAHAFTAGDEYRRPIDGGFRGARQPADDRRHRHSQGTTISGTMVIGLAPAFLFSRHVGYSPASFISRSWTGMLLGVLLALQGLPASWTIGSGKYAMLLGANLYGLALYRGLPCCPWLLRGPGPQVPGVRHECHRGTPARCATATARRPLPRPPSGRRKRSTSSAASTAISQLLKRSSRSPMRVRPGQAVFQR